MIWFWRHHASRETKDPAGELALRTNVFCLAAIGVIAILTIAAVASTWNVFSQVVDEPAHIAAGMEWLTEGRYDLEEQHPPLARVMVALGPWLLGATFHDEDGLAASGNAILYGEGEYLELLSAARAGVLPFLLLLIASVAWWGWQEGGPWTALLAVSLVCTLPPLLGHAGLATTDLPAAATITAALAAWRFWLSRRTLVSSAACGVAVALALVTKFSAVLFIPAGILAILITTRFFTRSSRSRPHAGLQRDHALAIMTFAALLVVWAAFRFSLGALPGAGGFERATAASNPRGAEAVLAGVLVPAPELIEGIRQLGEHSSRGHTAYFRGEISTHGWWMYFPVALAVKTPIPFLLLTAFALVVALKTRRAGILAPFIAASAILLAAMTSTINIGIRHLLPVYPLLAVAIATAASTGGSDHRRRTHAAIVAGLLLWQTGNTWASHPDWMAYFNEVAADAPHEWLLDSNLDWGQDLLRLEQACRRHGVSSLALSYFGSAIPEQHDLPNLRPAHPDRPTSGWIAVSRNHLHGLGAGSRDGQAFSWLPPQPLETVGKSILLYYVSPDIPARAPDHAEE